MYKRQAPVGGVVASACLAAIPLIILFYMLAVRKAKGHVAAAAGLIGALIVAVAVWNMPVSLAISSTLNGAAFGLFPIVWIVITAVWVYNMTVESGEFEIIKDSLARLTDDRRLQALFIAYAFSCFIEGTAGFGTPVAIEMCIRDSLEGYFSGTVEFHGEFAKSATAAFPRSCLCTRGDVFSRECETARSRSCSAKM